jgi:2-keto-3-deoxy-L-rhamnonate aldolase RhmA
MAKQSTPPRRGSERASWQSAAASGLVRNVDIIKIMKAAGFDWMFIDCEHGSTSIETACELSVAARTRASRRSCACPTAS